MDRIRTLPPGWILKECKDHPGLAYYYNESKNTSTWIHPELNAPQVYVNHINIKSSISITVSQNDPDYVPVTRSDSQAKKLAEEVRRLAVQNPENFIQLAKEHSDFKCSDVGKLGWVKYNQLHPALAEPVFKLEIGEISKVIASPFGYHIFQRVN